ncbi:MAG: DUF2225 domain-containing protein [Firmicutes bacterium]|nr:DUF2225 domain-containing protein [Bacillota bacterium]
MADKNGVTDTIIHVLYKISPFKELPEEVMSYLAGMAGVARAKQNEVFLNQAEQRGNIYVLISGKVKARLPGGSRWKTLGFGDIFCARPVSIGCMVTNQVIAMDDAVLFHFPKPELEELLNSCGVASNRNKPASAQSADRRRPGTDNGITSPAGGENREVESSQDLETKNWFFPRKHTCAVCKSKFTSFMPRSRYVQAERIDSDMCTYFRLANPTFYYIVVCGDCGYAFPQDSDGKLPAETVKNLRAQLDMPPAGEDYCGPRDIEQAISTYRLAIACQALAGAKNSLLGRLHLRLGCLYRQMEMPAEEGECLQKALQYLQQAYMHENISEPKSEIKLFYLIGDLCGRAGKVKEAVQWLSRVIYHPVKDEYPYLVNRARDRWQQLRIKERT